MSDIESIQGWHPHRPSCYSCIYYDPGIEHGDYGSVLSVDPNCFNEQLPLDQDNAPNFPYDKAPQDCISSGRYQLAVHDAFWASPFCESVDGSEESIDKAFAGFIWCLENIRAVGI